MAAKLRKGDKVVVLTGKDKGKQGEIAFVFPKTNKIIVNGINVASKHQRPLRANEPGGIIDKDMPIDASNVMIVCPDCGPTKIGARRDDEGRKYRVCRKCGRDLG